MDSPALYEVTYVCEGVAGKSRQFHVVAVSIEDAIDQSALLLEDRRGWAASEARCLSPATRIYATPFAVRTLAGVQWDVDLARQCVEYRLKRTKSEALSHDLHLLLTSLLGLGAE